MYCIKCGNRLIGNEIYCSSCGNLVNKNDNGDINLNDKFKNDGDKSASVALGIIGIIGSLLIIFSPMALVVSIIGLILGIKVKKRMGNVLGIILNGVALFLSLAMFLLILLGLYFSSHIIDGLWHEDTHYEEKNYYDSRYDF